MAVRSPGRIAADRALTGLARLALRGFYRRVEITGRERLVEDRPVLVVANHFNALLDPVLVMYAMRELPRFVAKAALWRPRWARPLLWLAGMVPIHRPQDGGDTAGNQGVFRSCAEQLARGTTVALFPEGGVSPIPALQPLRTGAARIALSARSAGTDGLVILPIGLTYEDKVALRSRALVRIGAPIDVDGHLDASGRSDADVDDTEVVRSLTAEIQDRLADLSPLYTDEVAAATLGRAADVALRRPDARPTEEVALVEREALARRLAAAPEEARTEVVDTLARYELRRSLAGLRDTEVVSRRTPKQLAGTFFATLVRLVLVAPFALTGAVVNALPYWGVHWAGRFVANPTLRASARLLGGVLLFPATWILVAWLLPWNTWWARTLAIVAAPVLGLVAVRALETTISTARAWHGWITRIERSDRLELLRTERDALVATIHRAAA
jgi:glycerol-3-phosphate O-acyltransferase / dihydroxyacetone phosphate acyltransferase